MSSKTLTIKVDLSHCDECVRHIKRLIRKFKGVESISIDVQNQLVTVSGHIDNPEKIVEKIRKSGEHVTMFSVHCDEDDVPEPETNTESTKNHESNDSTKEPGEGCRRSRGADQGSVFRAHGGQSKVNGYESKYFCAECENQNICFNYFDEWDGNGVQQCGYCRGGHEQPRAQNGKEDTGEFNDHKKCRPHGGQHGQRKFYGWGSEHFGVRSFQEWEGIIFQNCCCCCDERFYANEPMRVNFDYMPHFNSNHDFGHVHLADDMRTATESMPNLFDRNFQGDGISEQQCSCFHGEKFHAYEPKKWYFTGMPNFNQNTDFDCVDWKPGKRVHFDYMPTYYYYP